MASCWNFHVNCICSGVIHMRMVERIAGCTEDALARLRRMQPLAHLGRTETRVRAD